MDTAVITNRISQAIERFRQKALLAYERLIGSGNKQRVRIPEDDTEGRNKTHKILSENTTETTDQVQSEIREELKGSPFITPKA